VPPPDDANGGTGNTGLTGKFVGANRFAQCHPELHTEWSSTLHAGALDTLEGIGQDSNAQCIGCHTVGFGQVGGFVDRAATNALAGVQCENCHGAGGDHVNDSDTVKPIIDIPVDVCGACHQGAHHPNVEQWLESKHSQINEAVAADLLEGGDFVNNCGLCHSGDVFYRINVRGEMVEPDAFVGRPYSGQLRYLYYYALVDGSQGVHNPDYVRSILETAEDLLPNLGL
jgi:hypothetical protein